MTRDKFLTELKKKFPEYDFSKKLLKQKAIFGTKDVKPETYRTPNKDLIKRGNFRYIYISSIMYEGTKPKSQQFVYAIISTKAEKRNFRCKRFCEFELDKVYESGKTYAKLLEKLQGE